MFIIYRRSEVVNQVVAHRLGVWRIPEFFTMAAQSGILTTMALLMSWAGVDLSPARVIAGGIILLLLGKYDAALTARAVRAAR